MIAFSRVWLAAVPLFLATSAWSGDYQTGRDAYDIGDYATALTAASPQYCVAPMGDVSGSGTTGCPVTVDVKTLIVSPGCRLRRPIQMHR